jgi:hypothetical protein
MLGNLKLIVDTHCEIYRDLRPWTDDIFWDLTQHNFVPGAVYVIGRQQFRTHYAQIKTAVEQQKIKAIFSNPHEGSETIRWQLVAYGIDDLVRGGHILVISGGAIEPGYAHYQHENFVSKCFAYQENLEAQQHDVYATTKKPYQYLFLNGRARLHRKYLLNQLPLTQALWSSLDTGNGMLHNLPPKYEVARFSSNSVSGTGFVKDQLFGREWGDIYINPRAYTDTYFSVVTETVFDYPHSFRTEKIWKPIFMAHPWIAVANAGYYRDLRNLGFKTYDTLIDESFDAIENNQDRLQRIRDVIIDLLSQDLDQFLLEAQAVSKYNQQHMLAVSQQVTSNFPRPFLEFVSQYFHE